MTDLTRIEESEYWNAQGIEYLKGVNKPFSIPDARRCFNKALSLGNPTAEYNLHILDTYVEEDSHPVAQTDQVQHQTELYGYDKLSREERFNILRREHAGILRERISILKKANPNWGRLNNDELLTEALNASIINQDEYEELDDLRFCSNKIIHRNASASVIKKFDKNVVKWENIIGQIEKRLS